MDEVETRSESRRWRYRGSLFFPLLLITIGILFLLTNTGVISGSIWDILLRYWPVLLIMMGLDGLLKGDGLVGAIFILALGVVFLLSNLGMLALNIWEVILRLWPLLLVAIGLDILVGRRSRVGALIGMVILLAALFGALWFMGVGVPSGQTLQGEQISQPFVDAAGASIDLEKGAGSINLASTSESGSLVTGTVETRDNNELTQDFSIQGDQAIYKLEENDGPNVFIPGRDNNFEWELGLAREIPIDLEVSMGAGELTLDLNDLLINSLDVSLGVGQTTVTLPETSSFSGSVDSAIGQIVIIVPRGVGLRVQAGTGISSVQVPDGYQKQERTYTSPGYSNAEHRIELNLSQAIGSVVIKEG